MDFSDGIYSRPGTLFKTLRRLHGQNLESQGLNNLTEAFQSFMTRARYFSIGKMRRTWSHSAVEFLKYRRLLPMLTTENQKGDQFFDDTAIATTSWYDECDDIFGCEPALSKQEIVINASKKGERRVTVTNISPRVTSNQLMSFFSKFGKVTSCHVPSEERLQSMYATIRRSSRSSLTAYLTFRKFEDAQRALKAPGEELKFYDRIMVVSEFTASRKESCGSLSGRDRVGLIMNFNKPMDSDRLSSSSNLSLNSEVFSITELQTLYDPRYSMENLPTKVLAHILSFISPLDRIRIERVSKCFLEAAVKSWTLHNSLSFARDDVISRFFTSQKPMRNVHLQAFLSRCGLHLRQLDLSGVTHLLDAAAFDIISSKCPKLREVNITGLTGDYGTLRTFSEALPHLSSVTYLDMANVGDRPMWCLFKGNGISIRQIDLRGCRRIKGRCLRLFTTNLEQVLLDGCSRLDNIAIEDLCSQAPNVRELGLSGCFRVCDESISLIARSLFELERFSLCGDGFTSITSGGLMPLTRLEALSELTLDYNSLVSNELLEALFVAAPRLKLLSIAYAGSDSAVTEDVLLGIRQLKDLETLDISSLAAVTNRVVVEIGSHCMQLRNLRLRSCIYLGDEGASALWQLSNIELVDLSGCLLVTNSAVQTLLNAFPVKLHQVLPKKNVLVPTVTVVIGGTVCHLSGLKTVGSRVALDLSDYSALISDVARRRFLNLKGGSDNFVGSDEEISGDEFEALNAHRAFIIEVEQGEEVPSPEDDRALLEWAEREAANLGLVK